MITNKTQLNMVIGYPLDHSQSPKLHNALYQKLDIDAVLVAVSHKDISKLVDVIKTAKIGLTVVTMPHKQTIMPFLDKIDSGARAIAAINTVINKNGKLKGYNTDIDGIAAALDKVPLGGKNALLVGGGGAARAVARYLQKKKTNVMYLNRTRRKAARLQKDFGGRVTELSKLKPEKIDVIINATSVGMDQKSNVMPIPARLLAKGQYIFDVVYNAGSTELLRQAKERGATIIPGMEMFIGQALRQIELYSGKKIISPKIVKLAKSLVLRP